MTTSEPKRVCVERPVFNARDVDTVDNIRRCFKSFWDDDPVYTSQDLSIGIMVSRQVWEEHHLPQKDLLDLIFKNMYHYATRKLLDPSAKVQQHSVFLFSLGCIDMDGSFDKNKLSNSTLYEILNCIVLLGGSPHLFKDPTEQFNYARKTYSYLHDVLYPTYLSGNWKEYALPGPGYNAILSWRGSRDYAWYGYPWSLWPVIFYLRDTYYQAMTEEERSMTYPRFPQFQYDH